MGDQLSAMLPPDDPPGLWRWELLEGRSGDDDEDELNGRLFSANFVGPSCGDGALCLASPSVDEAYSRLAGAIRCHVLRAGRTGAFADLDDTMLRYIISFVEPKSVMFTVRWQPRPDPLDQSIGWRPSTSPESPAGMVGIYDVVTRDLIIGVDSAGAGFGGHEGCVFPWAFDDLVGFVIERSTLDGWSVCFVRNGSIVGKPIESSVPLERVRPIVFAANSMFTLVDATVKDQEHDCHDIVRDVTTSSGSLAHISEHRSDA
eukprot:gnl/MRDRNA2_/MRDRNA2_58200_c0_seq2.p1 gnl/MRDRNA2_/MRDRNA2_58200_c0~~gnl/MRDRNA2_/MRDRNA2_58200_c0_seq2.p1  ORF type:complete len:260 (+),score=48.00 gnl/MRDRNA2_/MRDRNA2_58200_c0_seq2:136-915(+)